MADIFSGIAPPNVTTTGTSQTIAPTQYSGFLSALGTAGTQALNPKQTLAGNIAEGQPLVAPLTTLQNQVFGTELGQANTANALQGALSPLTSAANTATSATNAFSPTAISNLYNPEVENLNKALETANTNNINQTVLPGLQSFFAGSGNAGSSRALNATGQALGNIQTGLLGQEATNNYNAYNQAATNALQNQQNLGSIAGTQGNIGTGTMNATVAGLNEASTLGSQGQAQTQAMINAPLSNATNVAQLLRGYTIPTTTNTTSTGPASSYGASPLSQIAGLASLFGSNSGGTSAAQGLLSAFGLTGKNDPNTLLSNFNSGVTTPGTVIPTDLTHAGGSNPIGEVHIDPETGATVDSTGKEVITGFD